MGSAHAPEQVGSLRILVVTDVWPTAMKPSWGVWALEGAEALRTAGNTVKVVRLLRIVPPNVVLSALMRGEVVKAFHEMRGWAKGMGSLPLAADYVRDVCYISPPRGRAHHLWGRWAVRERGLALRRVAEGFRPHVIIGHYASPAGDVAAWLARRLGIPHVVAAHGMDVRFTAGLNARARRKVADIYTEASAVLANSALTAHQVHELAPACRVEVLWQGGYLSRRCRIRMPGCVPQVISVGHLVDNKGHNTAVDAVAACLNSGVRFHWTVVGGGDDLSRQRLEERVRQAGIEAYVTIAGELDRRTTDRLLSRSDVMLLLARREAYGVVFAEALCHGIAVVGSAEAGAMRDFSEAGAPVLSVDPSDSASAARALGELLSNVEYLRTVQMQSWVWASRHLGWARYAVQLSGVLRDLVQADQGRRQ